MPSRAPRSILAGVLVALLAAPAAAQHPCPGHITANALAPVPRQAAVALSGRADSDAETRLRDAVLAGLRRAGHAVREDAPYMLSWRGGLSRDGLGHGGSVADMFSGSAFHDSDDLHWMQEAPRLGRRAPSGPLRLSGLVELRERDGRRVIWTAMVSCERHGADQDALFAALVGAVVPLIGRTVNAQPF